MFQYIYLLMIYMVPNDLHVLGLAGMALFTSMCLCSQEYGELLTDSDN